MAPETGSKRLYLLCSCLKVLSRGIERIHACTVSGWNIDTTPEKSVGRQRQSVPKTHGKHACGQLHRPGVLLDSN